MACWLQRALGVAFFISVSPLGLPSDEEEDEDRDREEDEAEPLSNSDILHSFDWDGDGKVSIDEFKNMITTGDPDEAQAEAERLESLQKWFPSFDDGDGFLDEEELMKLVGKFQELNREEM
eukprot:TRINITY_DN70529_c0_g1_i1.p1 TRINITY_DN70529_c0_g1~~TRINITY_DN70529_c0_g1_i1.p1  ORF type:complete len:121 (-),score=33.85 TRINITY_DN70529_c0_g1_i1:274-636(-)